MNGGRYSFEDAERYRFAKDHQIEGTPARMLADLTDDVIQNLCDEAKDRGLKINGDDRMFALEMAVFRHLCEANDFDPATLDNAPGADWV